MKNGGSLSGVTNLNHSPATEQEIVTLIGMKWLFSEGEVELEVFGEALLAARRIRWRRRHVFD